MGPIYLWGPSAATLAAIFVMFGFDSDHASPAARTCQALQMLFSNALGHNKSKVSGTQAEAESLRFNFSRSCPAFMSKMHESGQMNRLDICQNQWIPWMKISKSKCLEVWNPFLGQGHFEDCSHPCKMGPNLFKVIPGGASHNFPAHNLFFL